MIIVGIVLAAAGAAIALASDKLIEWSPWDPADGAVKWLKPWAWHLCAVGVGIVIGGAAS
jgi:hypothetical protein